MKKIPLTQGKFALVDNKDYEKLKSTKWWCGSASSQRVTYAHGIINGRVVLMHRVIMNSKEWAEVDHINHDGLDNRRKNLRNCTRTQNNWNGRIHKDNKCGFKGVAFHKNTGKYMAQIMVDHMVKNLGYFEKAFDAALAYDKAAEKYRGEFAGTNKSLGLLKRVRKCD